MQLALLSPVWILIDKITVTITTNNHPLVRISGIKVYTNTFRGAQSSIFEWLITVEKHLIMIPINVLTWGSSSTTWKMKRYTSFWTKPSETSGPEQIVQILPRRLVFGKPRWGTQLPLETKNYMNRQCNNWKRWNTKEAKVLLRKCKGFDAVENNKWLMTRGQLTQSKEMATPVRTLLFLDGM